MWGIPFVADPILSLILFYHISYFWFLILCPFKGASKFCFPIVNVAVLSLFAIFAQSLDISLLASLFQN